MKKRYLVRYWKLEQEEVEAHSPHSAVELVRRYRGQLESVEPVGGGDGDRLIPVAICAFCQRPQLAGINGLVGEEWHEIPDSLKDDPFDEVACPGCAITKGIISE